MGKQATIDVVINSEEAKRRFNELQGSLKDIKNLRDQAFAKGDVGAFKVYDKELKDVNKEIRQFKSNTNDVENALKNLNKISTNDLESALKKARTEMKGLNRDTVEYSSKKANFEKLRDELDKVNGSVRAQGSFFSKAGENFNRYFGLATTAIAGFTGVFLGLKQTITDFNDYQSKVANLSALTGLKDGDLDWISNKAKELSTSITEEGVRITQGADVIVDAFTKMGSAKPELLKDKEALAETTKQAIILSEAAKMELAPAVDGLALTMNQFGAGASEAARYVNVLAAGSKEGAAEIPDISASIVKFGAAAKTANVSVEESVGLIEALSEKGIKGEIAGTGLKTMLVKLMNGADEFNPKVVGMGQALDNLSKANLSSTEITKMFGLENFTVAKSLIESKDRVQELTKAVTGTNVAYEQANINTDTNAAKLEQQKNKIKLISIELGEKLAPVMASSLGLFTKFMQLIIASIGFYAKHSFAINSTVAVIGTYVAVAKLQAYWTAFTTKTTVDGIAVSKLSILQQKLHVFWTTASTAATHLFSAAQLLLTGKFKEAKIAFQAFSLAIKASPWGIAIAGIMAIGLALVAFSRHSATANSRLQEWGKNNADAYKNLVNTETSLNKLGKSVKDASNSQSEFSEAIRGSNFQLGQNNNLISASNQNKDIQKQKDIDRKRALSEYNTVAIASNLLTLSEADNLDILNTKMAANIFLIESKIQAEIISDELTKALMKKREIEKSRMGLNDKADKANKKRALDPINAEITKLEAELRGYKDINAKIQAEIDKQAQIRKDAEEKKRIEDEKKRNASGGSGSGKSTKSSTTEWQLSNDKNYLKEKLELEKERKNGIIATDEELNDQLLQLEIFYLTKRLATQKGSADERQKIEEQLVEKQITLQNNFRKKKEELTKKDIELIQQNNEQALTDLQIKNNNEFASITSLEQAKALLKDTMSAEELAKITNVYDAKKALRVKYDKDEQKLAIDQMAKLIDIFQKVSKDGFINDANLGKMLLTQEQQKEMEDKLAKLKEEFAKLKAAANGGEAPDKEKKQDSGKELKTASVDIFGFSEDDWQTLFKNLESGKVGVAEIAMAANVLVDIWKSYADIQKGQDEKEILRYTKNNDKKKKILSKRLEQGRVSQESYNSTVESMDAELDRKKAVIARDQAIRERNIALMSAIVNTAAAVVNALKIPPPIGELLAVAIGISGGLQIKKIMSTALPELPGAESGGNMLDVIRSQDGKQFSVKNNPSKRGYVSSPTLITGENGTEYILPKEALQNPQIANFVDFIEQARINGNLSKINLPGIQKVAGREMGGFAKQEIVSRTDIRTETNRITDQTAQLNEFTEVMKQVRDVLSKPIKAETYLRGPRGLYEAMKEDENLVNNAKK